MEMKELWKKAPLFWQKYKYVALVLAAGLLLMLLPEKKNVPEQILSSPEKQTAATESVEDRLAKILEQIDGAGKVSVMLSQERGEEILYQTNTDSDTGEESAATRIDTVIISASDRSEAGLIRQTNPPKYQGAVIVCQGGENPVVRLAIVEAVSNITGLGSNRISVVKMK